MGDVGTIEVRLDRKRWSESQEKRDEHLASLDDYDDRIGREAFELPEQRLKSTIIRFCEVVSFMVVKCR